MNTSLLPEINLTRCNGCADCVKACPQGALALDGDVVFFVHPEACVFCTTCEELCPRGAIRCAFEFVWGDEAGTH